MSSYQEGRIMNFGTEAQRQRLLPPICCGEKLMSS
ncbi:MAG: acyl-CoA dehydrogenase family protein [Candidatus Promineifilaceae bacterium]|nr:acyl-CoA dehydrogenase family protein [Candidatus Promineifilaceae bacterium]